jgi:hypothetical protein
MRQCVPWPREVRSWLAFRFQLRPPAVCTSHSLEPWRRPRSKLTDQAVAWTSSSTSPMQLDWRQRIKSHNAQAELGIRATTIGNNWRSNECTLRSFLPSNDVMPQPITLNKNAATRRPWACNAHLRNLLVDLSHGCGGPSTFFVSLLLYVICTYSTSASQRRRETALVSGRSSWRSEGGQVVFHSECVCCALNSFSWARTGEKVLCWLLRCFSDCSIEIYNYVQTRIVFVLNCS